MIYKDLPEQILFDSIIRDGADELKIVAGYAAPTMVSWHMKQIDFRGLRPIKINLIVGMTNFDGLSVTAHDGFRQLTASRGKMQSDFSCQYLYDGNPVHSKVYIWLKDGVPVKAFLGSANYTQSAFGSRRDEAMCECDPTEADKYYMRCESRSIYCNHAEVEDYITFVQSHHVLETEDNNIGRALAGENIEKVTLSFLSKNGGTGTRSGLNWGQRAGREPNQAYIPLPSPIAKSGFFPLGTRHFSVITDDHKQLILRVEQQNDKAITTPLNNSALGEYFRGRLGLPNGEYVWKADLIRYGRTDVDFYKLDEEQFYMDFLV